MIHTGGQHLRVAVQSATAVTAAHQQRTAEAEQRGGVCAARVPEASWGGQESQLST